jgi:hypothetical protein
VPDSDLNKIVAAILTAGRMHQPEFPRTMDDWLVEYTTWLDVLEKRDAQSTRDNDELADARRLNDANRS